MFPEPVKVIRLVPMGGSIKLLGQGMNTGLVHQPILSPAQLANLEGSPEQQPFDGDATKFKLGVEALRLGIAYEYDPYSPCRLPGLIRCRAPARGGLRTGHDFETLYPDMFRASGVTRCKLQMMRTRPQPEAWQLGPALAAGLTLRFYESFQVCQTLPALKQRIAAETAEYDRWGIHVLVSQTAGRELTIGDSHEYGAAIDPFDRAEIDNLILRYARGFLQASAPEIAQHWHGFYAKHPDQPFLSLSPAPNVRVVTATGGSGMTLSFGLAEDTVKEMGF
jgi:hypothetical protein